MIIDVMKIFITGEVHASIIEKFRNALLKIREVINKINNKSYGGGIKNWGYISIINPESFYQEGFLNERKHYAKKKKDLDMRLKIDYQKVLNASEIEMFNLISNSILSSVDIAEHELKISDFNFNAFRTDLTNLFKVEGWI
jgi:predicted transcriptional regulator